MMVTGYCDMLCYAVLCYAMLWLDAMLCYAVLCYAMLWWLKANDVVLLLCYAMAPMMLMIMM
eukprot:1506514-Karenia_brevis.AAC.1